MLRTFLKLTALVPDEPNHRPAALAEARALLNSLPTLTSVPDGEDISKLAGTVARDMDLWLGPQSWNKGAAEIAAAKADLLADLLRLHAALLCRRH